MESANRQLVISGTVDARADTGMLERTLCLPDKGGESHEKNLDEVARHSRDGDDDGPAGLSSDAGRQQPRVGDARGIDQRVRVGLTPGRRHRRRDRDQLILGLW